MKTALRRALTVADEIESFRWPGTDPERLYYAVVHVKQLALRLKASVRNVDHPWIRDAVSQLQVDMPPDDSEAGYALYAELEALADWLRDAIDEWGDDPSRWQPQPPSAGNPTPESVIERPLHTKERESLLKLVIGMAVAGYKYPVLGVRSGVPQEIADDLARHGVPLDVETVNKFLRQGRQLLPPEQNGDD